MYCKLLLLAFLSGCLAAPLEDPAWTEYKLQYGKMYSGEEDASRYTTWLENTIAVELHNAQYDKTYEQVVNQWTDMTDEQFQQEQMGGCLLDVPEEQTGKFFVSPPENQPLAETVDWRTKGYVTAVKNQGHCGSCYSFGATGSLEGAWFKKTGKLVSLSEQQMVDCSRMWGNNGCHGGWYQWCWQYLGAVGGSELETSYPYEAVLGRCRFDHSKVVAKVNDIINIRGETQLKQAIATVGPVAVAINAGGRGFRSYKRGVMYDPNCSKQLNHAVLAVGYGTEGSMDYWLIKNSWGTTFGASGYIKMARNKNNHCGIASRPAYVTV